MSLRHRILYSLLLAAFGSSCWASLAYAQEELPCGNEPIVADIDPLPGNRLDSGTSDSESGRLLAPPGPSENWFGGHRGQFSHRFDLSHSHPDDPARHIGFGEPLHGMSWRNRPFHFDTFAGTIMLQNLIPGQIEQASSFFDGFRLGYDFDHYWGAEMRLGFGQGRIIYPQNVNISGKSQLILLDYSVQFYPWGDTKWRPYALLGLGAAVFQYDDMFGRPRDQSQVSMPWGIGMKYLIHKRIALRFELLDNMTLGGTDASSSNNFSVAGSIEYRFGGNSPGYFQ